MKKLRFQYLYEVYRAALENPEREKFGIFGRDGTGLMADKYEVGERLNLNRKTVDIIVGYLESEGLVDRFTDPGSIAYTFKSDYNISHTKGLKK
jgi:hypothetical protein